MGYVNNSNVSCYEGVTRMEAFVEIAACVIIVIYASCSNSTNRSVWFNNSGDVNEIADITAGYYSLVKGQAFPTTPPISSSAFDTTSRARDIPIRNSLAYIQLEQGRGAVESIRKTWLENYLPNNSDKTDYPQWRDDYRDWFKNLTPRIFVYSEISQGETQHQS